MLTLLATSIAASRLAALSHEYVTFVTIPSPARSAILNERLNSHVRAITKDSNNTRFLTWTVYEIDNERFALSSRESLYKEQASWLHPPIL
jgi:hypothetical protein